MSNSDTENFVIAAKALSHAFGIDISGAEVGRLKAKSAKQAGDITKLIAEKANLSAEFDIAFRRLKKERDEAHEKAAKDADLIKDLYRRIDKTNETAEQFKKAAEEHNAKYWKLRDEALYGGDGEIANARAEYAELNKKLIRIQDVNDTLVRNNARLRENEQSMGRTNRENSQYNAELRQRLDQAENAVRYALQAITGEDGDNGDNGEELTF